MKDSHNKDSRDILQHTLRLSKNASTQKIVVKCNVWEMDSIHLLACSCLLRCDTRLDCLGVLLLKIGQASGGLVQARVLVLVQGGQSHIAGLGIIGGVGHVGGLFQAASLILVQRGEGHVTRLGLIGGVVSGHMVGGLALTRGNAVDDGGGVSRGRHSG